MKTPHLLLLAPLAFWLAAAGIGWSAETPPAPDRIAAAIAPSLVRVAFHLQYDKADAPRGGLGQERCPNCGRFHATDLREFLEDQRPVEIAGYLVAPDRVITADPLLHSRFLKQIRVNSGTQSVPATITAHYRDRKAILLSLGQPLTAGKPLQFGARSTPTHIVCYDLEAGRWGVSIHPFPVEVILPDRGQPHRLTSLKGVAISREGTALGLVLGSRLLLDDSWLGPPLEWAAMSAGELAAAAGRLEQLTRASLLRVRLNFRSPKRGDSPMSRYRYAPDDEGGEEGTERNVLGLAVGDNRLLVAAHLKARTTARLDRITVFPAQGEPVPAKFTASLKDFGAIVITADKPLSGAVALADTDLLSLPEQLLLRAEVSLQGEARAAYFGAGRISTCRIGFQGEFYPELDEPDPRNSFLFTLDGRLIALPMTSREQVSAGRADYFRRGEIGLVPARQALGAVSGLPATADAGNVPLSEAEENRLAWLGVELQPLNRELARANNVSDQTRDGETGALVTHVHPDSPAAKAGVKTGWALLRVKVPGQPLPVEIQLEEDQFRAQPFPWDRLDQVQDQYFDQIPTPWPSVENSFTRALTELGFGTRYTAEFFAEGKVVAMDFEVVTGPAHYDAAPRFKSEPLGLTVRDLTYDVRRFLQRKPEEPGVVVSKVEAGGRASVAGVKPYEIVTHVNDQPVNTVQDFEKAAGRGGELRLSIKRMAKGRIVTVKPAP